jgi:hypothetical protein
MQSACAILSNVGCPAVPYFFTLSHKWHDLRRKNYWTKMCIMIFSATSAQNATHSKKWARYRECTLVFVQSSSYFFRVSMKVELSRQIFRNIIKYKILWDPSSESRVPCEWTDRRIEICRLRSDESYSRSSQFCERAYHSVLCSVRFVSVAFPPKLLGH